MRKICTTLLLGVALIGAAHAQNVNPPHPLIIGHSFVAMAPWSSAGIPGNWIRGFDSATCPYISALLPWLVPQHTPAVALVEGTNDVVRGTPASVTAACLGQQIAWLQLNRPGIQVTIATVAPMSLGNCDGDYRIPIAQYSVAYRSLAESYGVSVADISTAITEANGWANEAFMDGDCKIHPGLPGIPNAGWSFFMGQIIAAMNGFL